MRGIIAFICASCALWVTATIGIVTIETADFTAETTEEVELIAECTEEPKKAVFKVRYIEPTEPSMTGFGFLMEDLGEGLEVLLETAAVEPVHGWEMVEARIPYVTYGVDGHYMDDTVYEHLASELRRRGIEWWLPYAVCEAFQESTFNPNAQAPHGDGFDCGLFQYYDRYWESRCSKYGITEWPNSIFDPIVQVEIYAAEFGERLNAGASIEKALSDHYSSGAFYAEQYVNDVLQWVDHLTER